MRIFVAGGADFIGSAAIRHIIRNTCDSVVNLDKLTYAGNFESQAAVNGSERYVFEQVGDRIEVERVFREYQPDTVHLAAESHVDGSIDGPAAFIETNLVGTDTLLGVTRQYWQSLDETGQAFRFRHISTDEVYSDLENSEDLFAETSPYVPGSPYSVSKASSDHLVCARRHYVRAAHAGHKLFEQLRPVALPRKADSTDDPQHPRRQATANPGGQPSRQACHLHRGNAAQAQIPLSRHRLVLLRQRFSANYQTGETLRTWRVRNYRSQSGLSGASTTFISSYSVVVLPGVLAATKACWKPHISLKPLSGARAAR